MVESHRIRYNFLEQLNGTVIKQGGSNILRFLVFSFIGCYFLSFFLWRTLLAA